MPSTKFTPDSLPMLNGNVYVVTGGNAGIGKATVAGLASRGAKVYMGARSESKALVAIESMKKEIPDANIEFLEMDLTDFKSVVAAAQKVRSSEHSLHGLINNAGIMAVPFQRTVDGFDSQFQTNYLSHWLLTYHLMPLLSTTAAAGQPGDVRIINLTSDGHNYAPKEGINFKDINLESEASMRRYGQSKLANILHSNQLHSRYGPDAGKEAEIWTAAVHPGHINTDLNRQASELVPLGLHKLLVPVMVCLGILDEQAKGALSSLYAAASQYFSRSDSGRYIIPYAKVGVPSALARNPELAVKLWEWTEKEFAKRSLL